MEKNVKEFTKKMKIVRQWYGKVAVGSDEPLHDESIVILLDTLGAI